MTAYLVKDDYHPDTLLMVVDYIVNECIWMTLPII